MEKSEQILFQDALFDEYNKAIDEFKLAEKKKNDLWQKIKDNKLNKVWVYLKRG